jgi:putative lipoic acid-binding regulatory protein
MMNEESLRSLQAKLDECHQWPCRFMFKFIVPQEKSGELTVFFADRPFTTRPSKNGRYVSFTAELEMQSSGEVIALYREAGKIEGIISM